MPNNTDTLELEDSFFDIWDKTEEEDDEWADQYEDQFNAKPKKFKPSRWDDHE